MVGILREVVDVKLYSASPGALETKGGCISHQICIKFLARVGIYSAYVGAYVGLDETDMSEAILSICRDLVGGGICTAHPRRAETRLIGGEVNCRCEFYWPRDQERRCNTAALYV